MPSLSLKIPAKSDKERMILRELSVRVRASTRELTNKHKAWLEAENEILAYLPEREVDTKRRALRENGLPQYTTIKIPYTYAVLMSAHTYLTSVFMGRSPILQYTGRHGESQQKVQAMEALAEYQILVGAHLVPLYTWLYDAGKYGLGVLGLYWEDRIERVSSIEAKPVLDIFGQPTGKVEKVQTTIEAKTYSGNKIYNIQPWDFLWDVRYPARDYQKGEYCALRFSLSWNECKRRERKGYYINLNEIGPGQTGDLYAAGNEGDGLRKTETTSHSFNSWDDQSGTALKHPQIVKGYEVYVELIPSEWGLSDSDYPEKWVFTCTADFSRLIGVTPLGALHSKFPVHILPLDCEAYGLITRGFPEILTPIQQTVDWLVNSHFYNVRAALNNKYIVDPSRVVMKDVLDPLPGGVVRLKPSAYGQDPRLAMHQLTVTDVTQNNIRDSQVMFGIGERTVGINDQIMGMINGGGRKTATEIRTSTTFGVNRLKTIAEWFSAVGFDPYSQMMVQNTQQYYTGEQQYKVAGDLLLNAGKTFMTVTPDSIAGFYDYVPVDGTLPIDRFAQTNLWKELMAQSQRMPQLAMGYDWVGIFEWVAQLAGLKNISQFKVQIAPDALLQQQAAAGNVVPLPPGGPQRTNLNEPKQIPNMGATG